MTTLSDAQLLYPAPGFLLNLLASLLLPVTSSQVIAGLQCSPQLENIDTTMFFTVEKY